MKFLRMLIVFLITGNLATAQNGNLNSIDDITYQLIKNMRSLNAEKIVLETNKKIYNLYENIYFKAVLIDSVTGKLTNTSKVFFIDLIDKNDKVIHSLVLNTSNAQETGAFLIDSMLNGYYWLRAYTSNILHNGINSITVKPVYIFNSTYKNNNSLNHKTTSLASDDHLDITLYPEGGSVMSGAEIVVGVKASYKGNPVADSGFIKNNKGDIETTFVTNKDGLGRFTLQPSIYKKYVVFFKINNKYDSVENIPAVNPFAAQIAVTEQTDQNIKLRVLLEDSIYKKDYKTFLIGLHKDSVCVAATGQGMYEFNIPISNFPSGVANLLLFNSKGELLSERNIFINRNNLNITLKTEKDNYAARENINLNITITNDKGNPVPATLAVAVNDSRVCDSVNDLDLNMLQKLSKDDADLIMLTQQNESIDYFKHIYSLKNDALFKSEKENLLIKGLLVDKKKNFVADKSITFLSLDKSNLILQDTTDASGRFSIISPPFSTGTGFSLQVNNEQRSADTYDVILDPISKNDFKTPLTLKQKFPIAETANINKIEAFYADRMAEPEWLPHVTVAGTKNKNNPSSRDVISKEILHSGRINNVGDAVLENGKFHIVGGYLMAGGSSGFSPSASDEPVVMIDGMQMGNAHPLYDILKTMPVSDIDHINLLTESAASIYGMRSGSGVIEIFTLSKSDNPVFNSSLKIIYPKGFDMAPVFQTPDYTIKQLKNSKEPDMRTVIYWNGNVTTDANGNAKINFFAGDATAVYVITVSGITANGIQFHKTITLNRK